MHHRAKSILGRKYHGYRPPPATHKLLLSAVAPPLKAAPPPPDSVDLRPFMLAVRDQGQEGACSGFATAALREAIHAIAYGSPLDDHLSPAYLYGRTRQTEGTFPADSGCTIVDEMATLQAYGACPESMLPYSGNASEAPTPDCDVAAVPFRAGQPLSVDWSDSVGVRQVLAQQMPIVIGIEVHESFERTGGDGLVPSLSPGEGLVGGHALVLCGYRSDGRWIVRNSWSSGWGDSGYCYLDSSYLQATAMEAWAATPID